MGDVLSPERLLTAPPQPGTAAAAWVAPLRQAGAATFVATGVPTRRHEAWKYSDLAQALGKTPVVVDSVGPVPIELQDAYLAAFVDGRFDAEASTLPSSVVALGAVLADPTSPFAERIGQINPTEQQCHPLLALNAARMGDGLVLHLADGETLDKPLHLRFTWTAEGRAKDHAAHMRFLVLIGDGAQATLIETHQGTPGFATLTTEVSLGAAAALSHVRLETLSWAARQSAVTVGELAANALYQGFYLSEGGFFARHEALFALQGAGARVELDGAFLVDGKRHCDNTTIITHAVPDTTSHQAFRGVLAGAAQAAYQGCVKVRPDAQHTDAHQMSRALLLSETARIATKPELEIFADDVKCSHGATAGELDAQALFFLRARGIPLAEARAMLIEAFLQEPLEAIADAPLRRLASAAITAWLATQSGEA